MKSAYACESVSRRNAGQFVDSANLSVPSAPPMPSSANNPAITPINMHRSGLFVHLVTRAVDRTVTDNDLNKMLTNLLVRVGFSVTCTYGSEQGRLCAPIHKRCGTNCSLQWCSGSHQRLGEGLRPRLNQYALRSPPRRNSTSFHPCS